MLKARELSHRSDPAHLRGLRNVGAVEILKGVLAMVGAIAVAVMLSRQVDLQEAAWAVVNALHIDPDRRVATMFIDGAARAMDIKGSTVILGASVYSALRFIEGYGLWNARVWAEWLALLSGTIYLPWEIRALIHRPSPLHWAFLLINLAIIAYIAWVRFGERWVHHFRRMQQERAVERDTA
jgi:uncharacterized membrane protein (DUF2068 family)